MKVITSRPIYCNVEGRIQEVEEVTVSANRNVNQQPVQSQLALNRPTNITSSTKPTQLQGSSSTNQPTGNKKVFGNLFQKKEQTQTQDSTNQPTGNKKVFGNLFQKKEKPETGEKNKLNLKNIFQGKQVNPVLYNKMLTLSMSMDGMNQSEIANIMQRLTKEEKSILYQIERERIRTERKDIRKNRKAKRNAKKLLRLKNKQGKEVILFPLTRLRRNKDNKLVKTYPDGTETIVKPEMAVQITTIEPTPTGNVTKVIEVDKAEVAEVLQVPINTVTPQLIEQKKIELPVSQAPIQAQETKTIGTENVVGITIDPGNVTTDENGISYASTQTQNQEEPIKDVVDSTKEEKVGMSLGLKIGIGAGVIVVLGVIGYFIYKSTSKGKK